jgi:haloacetate dehalogenase
MADLADLFPGFAAHWIDTDAGRIFARAFGAGPPLVLLHGFPQTHVMWHRLAADLARHFSVVIPDLRGYGWSSAPASEHGALYSKRAMGGDLVQVMEKLGHVRFRIVGHDRGARVAYRLALDHPGRVEKLALLDILPTFAMWEQIAADPTISPHWTFLSGEAPGPEREIGKDPATYAQGLMKSWTKAKSLACFDPRAMAYYQASFTDPSRIHAYCEDYRAGATIDRAADAADIAAGKTLICPVLLVSGDSYLPTREAPGDVWRRSFAPRAEGEIVPSGHFLAEENAGATLQALTAFL